MLIRKAQTPGVSFTARRAHAPVFTREAIRGKTGPVPNGAVLFGPFSWAYKKKDVKKKVNHRLAVSQHRSVQAGAHDNPRRGSVKRQSAKADAAGDLSPRGEGESTQIYMQLTPARTTISSHGTQREKLSAISCQLEAIGENQIQHPHLPNFPACGAFLLTRPKGTKSRRRHGAVHMHSANCLTGCTGSTALPTTRNIGPRRWTEARSALRVLSRHFEPALVFRFSGWITKERGDQTPKTGSRYGLAMSIPFVLTTSPHIPCLRRVPFDTTKRNQKSPLGAGPSICIARIASRVAPDLLPCQPRRNIGPRRWTEPHALL